MYKMPPHLANTLPEVFDFLGDGGGDLLQPLQLFLLRALGQRALLLVVSQHRP